MHGRRVAEHVDDLERGRLLALDAQRVDRVHDLDARLLAELAHDVERVVEVAVHGHHARAVDERLRELAQRDLALPGCTTAHIRPARAAYAAADADVLPVDAQITTLAPCSTAFEIAIVMPRSLNEPVGFAPSTFSRTRATPARCRDPGRLEQRRVALEQRDHRRRVGHRQPVAVRLDEARATRRSVSSLIRSPTTRSTEPTRCTTSTLAQGVERGDAGRPRVPVRDEDRAARRRPMPRCCIDWIDTPCAPNSPAIAAARRAGRPLPSSM